jgi:aminopeptidase C
MTDKTNDIESGTRQSLSECSDLLALANNRLREIHAILTDQAIELQEANGAVTGYTAQLDQETFRTLMNLSDGLGHDES